MAELIALGVTPVMLIGGNVVTALTVAKLAGISDARGNSLPEDKLKAIEDMQKQYGPTAMGATAPTTRQRGPKRTLGSPWAALAPTLRWRPQTSP